MNVNALMRHWESNSTGRLTRHSYPIKLPVEAAAKIEALTELFPGNSTERIITDLLTAALDEFETSLPYVRGRKVVRLDEMGDPVYEDAGPTPRYLSLSKTHLQRFKQQLD